MIGKCMVALITPFTSMNTVDIRALKELVIRLMQDGVDGFVVCGTTAEVCTLSIEERDLILRVWEPQSYETQGQAGHLRLMCKPELWNQRGAWDFQGEKNYFHDNKKSRCLVIKCFPCHTDRSFR